MIPKTQYAKSGDVHVAYQVVGEGPFDLLFVPGFVSNLDLAWEAPARSRVFTRLSAFSRLIMFDKRGTGLSDRTSGLPTLDERMDDVRAVMDAAGSPEAALFGVSEGGAMAMLFAATHPDRVRALALYGTYGRFSSWVVPPERLEAHLESLEAKWGTGATVDMLAPSVASDQAYRLAQARWERLSASPSAASALTRMNSEIDVRAILPSIRVPTLIIHREGDVRVNVEAGRFLARKIPNAKYVELPGIDHLPWVGNTDRIIDEVEEFLTGSRPPLDADRVLATVMFTILSTQQSEPRSWGIVPGTICSTATMQSYGRK